MIDPSLPITIDISNGNPVTVIPHSVSIEVETGEDETAETQVFDDLHVEERIYESDDPRDTSAVWSWAEPPPAELLELLGCTEQDLLDRIADQAVKDAD